jgi:glucose/arabinose dehydrogenase
MRMTVRILVVVTALVAPMLATAPAQAAISAQAVATGLNRPVGFTINPADPNELWYGERNTGEIRRRNIVTSADNLVYTITNVLTQDEQGLLGIAFDPAYPTQPYVYVYVTRQKATPVNMVIKVTISGGVGVARKTLLKDPTPRGAHIGGRIKFGPDGMLYVAIGEHTFPPLSQDLNSPAGKIHRIAPNGDIPADNPFPNKSIWAYGVRNSYGFTWDPATNFMWDTDNGPDCNDEVNRIQKGQNYSWGENFDCALSPAPQNTNNDGPVPRRLPKWFLPTAVGITGAAFCTGCGLTEGALYVGSFNSPGNVYELTLSGTRKNVAASQVAFANNGFVISVETLPGQPIYFSDFTSIYKLVGS